MGITLIIVLGAVAISCSAMTVVYRYKVAKFRHVETMEATKEQERLAHDDQSFHTILVEKRTELLRAIREVEAEVRGFRAVVCEAASEVKGLKKAVEEMPTAKLLLLPPKGERT
jgi:hypothetical protein